MHLIVVRRDLTGFQHLHPTQRADGTWTTPLRLDEAGSYRVFADFSHDGEPQHARHRPARRRHGGPAGRCRRPRPSRRSPTAATTCALDARPTRTPATRPSCASRSPATAGPCTTEPYLGAGGHLVALREGDLAFLHVHPTERRRARTGSRFDATFPTAGRYRLFLQFQADGRVHTVAFTAGGRAR